MGKQVPEIREGVNIYFFFRDLLEEKQSKIVISRWKDLDISNVYIVGEYIGGEGTNLVTHVSSFPGGADISISLVGTQRG